MGHKKEGISPTIKKKIVLPTLNAPNLTSAAAGASTTSAPLKIKIPSKSLHAQSASIEERQRQQTNDGTRKKHIFLGKIPDDEEPEAPIEEQFILRLMVPEDVKQRFREKVRRQKFAPEDVEIMFKDSRRAIFTFENQKYSARLVDLPCIIEAQKTFNNKQFYKVADICQMLIVESPIDTQEEVHMFTENMASSSIDQFEWPDGLTPPLKNVRNRRFRKRISNKKIEDIEKEVEKLLHDDSLAEEVKIDWEDAVDSETATPAALAESIPEEADDFDADVVGEDDDYEAEDFEDDMDIEALQEYEQVLVEGQTNIRDESENDELAQNDDITEEFRRGLDQLSDDDSHDSNAEDVEESDASETDSEEENQEELNKLFTRQRELTAEVTKLEGNLNKKLSDLRGEINAVMQGRIQNQVNTLLTEIEQKKSLLAEAAQRVTDIKEKMESKVEALLANASNNDPGQE
ncbi:TAFII55 protein conserved region-domain-containing protein [Gigaspora rosea]|uniref:TAFII55 protein conserved region-domain-containing protein n=1 Tax=Gigaspora rosea TaxID=44941 RepID=A0A397VEC4_9GLOM|nr:TAFII55 protein conserved region-domain-containing protein [Gigaspora rosea]